MDLEEDHLEGNQMKQFKVVTPEIISKIDKCFASQQEAEEFMLDFHHLISELDYITRTLPKADKRCGTMLMFKQLCQFSLFCREYSEIIQNLLRTVNYELLTEEQIQEMTKE